MPCFYFDTRDGDSFIRDEIGDDPKISAEYLRSRELAERSAAKNCRQPAVRKLHLQLAGSYAARRRGQWSPTLPPVSCSKEG